MHALSSAELLDAWERGLDWPSLQRALILIGTACPDTPPQALAELPIGQRDGCLLTLRELTFGPRLSGVIDCPACSEQLELGFTVADMRMMPEEERADLSVTTGEFTVELRLPNSLDLAGIVGYAGPASPASLLFERCLLAARHGEVSCSADQLPPNVVEAAVEQMSRADPQADVWLALSCPTCCEQWRASFDILTFFWSEIDAWARRILRDVDSLARAYGWSEPDILALSPRRRQFYLEIIGA
jgi:hypothetical protein